MTSEGRLGALDSIVGRRISCRGTEDAVGSMLVFSVS